MARSRDYTEKCHLSRDCVTQPVGCGVARIIFTMQIFCLNVSIPSPQTLSSCALSLLLAASLACPSIALAEPSESASPSSSSATSSERTNGPEKTAGAESEPYEILKGDTDLEKLTDELVEAREGLAEADARVAELQVEIDEAEAVLPAQQARSDAGIKQRYIMQSNPLIIVESLLASNSFGDFLRQTEYWEAASQANLRELNRLLELKEKLENSRAELDRVREEAESRVSEVETALREIQDERDAKQRKAVAEARRQATAGISERPATDSSETSGGSNDSKSNSSSSASSKKKNKKSESSSASSNASESSGSTSASSSSNTSAQAGIATTTDTESLMDGADWYMDRDAFIEEWSARIDAYLEGTPMAGLGEAFAEASWKHCVDPRWSPAISFTESSNGRVCIRPHNAWGWGAADSDPYNLAAEWSSWEQAIDAHVRGLSKGYGYTISLSNARTYCPPNWQLWYNRTLGEMQKI